MKKLSSIAALGCFLLAPAFASASIDTSVSFSYGMADSVFDEDGEKSSIDEAFGLPDGSVSANFMIIGLGAGYQVMDGLDVHLDLPIVQKTFKIEAGGQVVTDEDAFGLGDPTIGATYMHSINDTLAVGGGLDVKLSLGSNENLLANSTDGATHITAKGLLSAAPVDGLAIDLDAGYIVTIGGKLNTVNPTDGSSLELDVDQGDTLFTNLYVGYTVAGFTPRLGVHYSQTGEVADEDGNAAENSDKNRMSISASVDYDISDSMSVTAGLGTNSIHEGTNLNYGYALTGKNYTAGLAFGLGFSAAF